MTAAVRSLSDSSISQSPFLHKGLITAVGFATKGGGSDLEITASPAAGEVLGSGEQGILLPVRLVVIGESLLVILGRVAVLVCEQTEDLLFCLLRVGVERA